MTLTIIGIFNFFCLYFSFTYLLDQRFLIKKFFIHSIRVFIPVFLSYLYLPKGFTIFLFLILTVLIFRNQLPKYVLIINFSVLVIIGVFSDSIIGYLKELLKIDDIYWLSYILLFGLLYFSQVLLYKTIVKLDIDIDIYNKKIIFLGIFLLITVIFFYLNIFKISLNNFLTFNLIWQAIYIVLIITLLVLFNYNSKKEFELKNKEIMQTNFSEYTKKLAEVNMEMQKFRHDYLNILATMQQYLENEEIEKLKEFFYREISPLGNQTLFRNKLIGTLENVKILEIKSILISKIIQASNLNIDVNIEISSEINSIYIDTIDFARVLGVFLDNAIEASLKVSNPKINLALISLENNELLLIIENKYDGKKIDINRIHQVGISHKKESNGLGLANVREILSKYNNVVHNTRLEKDWFIQEIQIRGVSY